MSPPRVDHPAWIGNLQDLTASGVSDALVAALAARMPRPQSPIVPVDSVLVASQSAISAAVANQDLNLPRNTAVGGSRVPLPAGAAGVILNVALASSAVIGAVLTIRHRSASGPVVYSVSTPIGSFSTGGQVYASLSGAGSFGFGVTYGGSGTFTYTITVVGIVLNPVGSA